MVYPALLPLLPLMRTTWLPEVDWTDPPTNLNGLVHFAERPNPVSAHVASCFKCAIPHLLLFVMFCILTGLQNTWRSQKVPSEHQETSEWHSVTLQMTWILSLCFHYILATGLQSQVMGAICVCVWEIFFQIPVSNATKICSTGLSSCMHTDKLQGSECM